MIRIHIDNHYSTGIEIHVDISMKNFTNSTPKKAIPSPIISNSNKKIYTLQQIHDNVETIQKHYEQILDNPIASSSCFYPFKQMTKIFKNIKTLRTKPIEQTKPIEYKSPFIFGGETLQWIALPQDHDHIYENELLNETIFLSK
jgi:hypothetical protein